MSDLPQIGDRLLVIYDGVCGLCNRSVRWLLCRDRNDRLRFVPSSSPKVATLLAQCGLGPSTTAYSPSSIFVVCNAGGAAERVVIRSDAVLALLGQLPGMWPAIAILCRLIPRPLRDLVYRLIARNRYRIWGRLDSCPIPTPAERGHFLD